MSNVRSFGAAGDGVTDDTEAIEHAVKDGDGVLLFPPGSYRIERTIEIPLGERGPLGIDGISGSSRVVMHGAGPAFRIVGTHGGTGDPNSAKGNVFPKQRMPTIQNIEIEGAHEEADGIQLVQTIESVFEGVLFRHCRHAIHLTERNRNVLISHCHIYHNRGVGVFMDAVNLHQIIISGSHISYNRLGGIRIENSEIRNLQITGNDIEYNNVASHPQFEDEPTAEIYIDVRKQSLREATIASNTIQATPSKGGCNIRLLGQSDEIRHKVGMITISGNLIGNQEHNIHVTSARGVTISGNHIYGAYDRNIRIEKSSNVVFSGNCLGHNADFKAPEMRSGVSFIDSQDCVISGMLIQNCRAINGSKAKPTESHPLGLVELIRCQRINLSSSQLQESDRYGLYVDDCQDPLVTTGCSVQESPTKQMRAAIYWKGAATGSMVSNCRLGKGTEQTIVAEESLKVGDNCYDPA